MENQLLEVKTKLQIQKPAAEIFEASGAFEFQSEK
jgi:hypothetical protein